MVAYQDILPLLDYLAPNINIGNHCHRKEHVLYDPYYCNGRTKELLQSLGFTKVQHQKRDFYQDIANETVPFHHIFVTNPPYSACHKVRCIQYAVEKLRTQSIPFFLLMPNYIVIKEYFRSSISNSNKDDKKKSNNDPHPSDIFYVLPSTPYEYDHPEGTGHDGSPFASFWFCGMSTHLIQKAKNALMYSQNNNLTDEKPLWVSSLHELGRLKTVPSEK